MLIRRLVAVVFKAFIDPAVTVAFLRAHNCSRDNKGEFNIDKA
jgi:hypothetical protein